MPDVDITEYESNESLEDESGWDTKRTDIPETISAMPEIVTTKDDSGKIKIKSKSRQLSFATYVLNGISAFPEVATGSPEAISAFPEIATASPEAISAMPEVSTIEDEGNQLRVAVTVYVK